MPDSQAQFWTSRARDVIHAFADHFSSLASDNPLAVTLSSQVSWGPSGDHLKACIQEALTPPHITSTPEVWLTSQAGSFEEPLAPTAPAPPSSAPSDPSHPRSSLPPGRRPWLLLGLNSLHNLVRNPSTVLLSQTFLSRQLHLLKLMVPFKTARRPSPEVGPVRLTRFLEMSTDVYCATVNSLIAAGRFNHIGEASVLLEGQTACGVWLRIDHWRASRRV